MSVEERARKTLDLHRGRGRPRCGRWLCTRPYGGSGSIFAVPLLIYALAVPPEEAMPVLLVAVALTVAFGAAQSLRNGLALWRRR